MAPIEMAADNKQERAMSLPQLQSLMRRDPEAYGQEFEQQWLHFTSMMDIFKLKPTKPNSAFSEQVMFLAHVAPSFPDKASAFPGIMISALTEHGEVMHPSMRQVLVQALIMLRNRDQFPCIRTLPLYFKLFRLQDKGMRSMIFSHIVRDIVQMSLKPQGRSQKTTKEFRDFFFSQLQDGDVEVSRRACAAFISLYRQNIWRDAGVVNMISAGLVHADVKISAALAHLFLGNKTKGLEGILEESDKSDAEDVDEAIHGIVGSKKTARREKRIMRAKKAAKKALQKKKRSNAPENTAASFVAIDLLNDPQTLADRLLARVSKGGEPFLFRLLLLHLVARIVGRHELLVLNLYPFVLKYLVPQQREVTKVLACLVEACHRQLPPEEVRPVVLHVMHSFVSEANGPEVIEVGLNGIREVCARAVNILTEDELADLAGFRKHKNKGVSMAARSLINLYRELHPQLLHRSLRGREAAMALTRGEVLEPQFGDAKVSTQIDGLEMLVDKKLQKMQQTDEEGASKEGTPAAAEQAGSSTQKLMTDSVLSTQDLQKLRKMRIQKSIELQLGRKRKAEEVSSSSSGSEASDEEEEEKSEGERGLSGRLPGSISGAQLQALEKKSQSKTDRLKKIKAGRTDFKQKALDSRKNRKGGKTNSEHRRNKPLMMAMQSKDVKRKQAMNAKQKMQNMKKHISTLKKTVHHQKRRR